MTKKILKIVGIVFGVVVLIVVVLLIDTRLKIKRGDLVKWDNHWYTKEELAEKYPPQYYEAEAKNTPEEVYATFRQALLDNDLEKALGLITEKSRGEYREALNIQETFNKYKNIPEVVEIKKSEKDSYGNFANYYYFTDKEEIEIPFSIRFIKNYNGFWEIDFI